MNETNNSNSGDLAERAEELEDFEEKRSGRWWKISLVVLIVLAALGGITTLLGIGPFGYRLFAYGMVKIHLYNGTPHFAHVEIDGVEMIVRPFEGKTVDVVGGALEMTTTLELVKENAEGIPERTDQMEILEKQSLVADGQNFFYHIATPESSCLAIVDMMSYYRKGVDKEPKIVSLVSKDRRLQALDSDYVYYAQAVLPDQLKDPPMLWLPVVACTFLDEPEKLVESVKRQAVHRRRQLEKDLEERRQQFAQ